MTKEITLKVTEALQNDVGRGIVRVDSQSAHSLGVTSGDVIEIKGKNLTGVIVWLSHPQDEGLGIVRMDGIIRQNSASSLGDKVIVRKARPETAHKVVIAPTIHEIQVGDTEIQFGNAFKSHVKRLFTHRPMVQGDGIMIRILGRPIPFSVISTSPRGVVQIQESTELEVKSRPDVAKPAAVEVSVPSVRYEDIGGLRDEVGKVREMIELPMKHPELFEKLGIEPPKGVLLHGPPGTGKTLLAKAVASETNAHFMSINGPEIVNKYYGESEKRLREIFDEAQQNAPAIIFIDEIDSIAPKREETHGEVERRIVAQLLALMDGLVARGDVVVIAATNRPDSIDPALRRPGRFDREIEIGVPDKSGRREVLQIHTRGMPIPEKEKDRILDEMANITHGYVGADLAALAREAAMSALRKMLPKIDLNQKEIPVEILEDLHVGMDEFAAALKNVEPSALREVFLEVPEVKWNDIGGLEKVKQELKEVVELTLKHPEVFKRMGIRQSKGILMYGPPGTGKTLLAKAVANESEANFISVKGPEVLSKWVGESEKRIREIFKKARQTAPTIIFFDELDSVAPRRGGETGTHVTETVLNQILTEIDGMEAIENVIVIGATNRVDMIDSALLRPGRFDGLIMVPAPDEKARLEIFKVHTKKMPLKGVDLKVLVDRTKNYTGADIEGVCRMAGIMALRESMDAQHVEMKHFEKALEEIKPSVSEAELAQFGKLRAYEFPNTAYT